jgi:hypothetical protein
LTSLSALPNLLDRRCDMILRRVSLAAIKLTDAARDKEKAA